MYEVICGKRILAAVKGRVSKTVARPSASYGPEAVPLTRRQGAQLETAKLKMFRFSLEVTRTDMIRNYIRGTFRRKSKRGKTLMAWRCSAEWRAALR